MNKAIKQTKKARPELIEKGQGKRLLEFMARKNIKSRSSFARIVGVSSSSINEIVWNFKEIKENLQSKILVAFPDIDMNWLISGKSTELLTVDFNKTNVSEPETNYKKVCLECLKKDKIIDNLRQEVNHWQKKYIDCLEEIAGLKKDVASG